MITKEPQIPAYTVIKVHVTVSTCTYLYILVHTGMYWYRLVQTTHHWCQVCSSTYQYVPVHTSIFFDMPLCTGTYRYIPVHTSMFVVHPFTYTFPCTSYLLVPCYGTRTYSNTTYQGKACYRALWDIQPCTILYSLVQVYRILRRLP